MENGAVAKCGSTIHRNVYRDEGFFYGKWWK